MLGRCHRRRTRRSFDGPERPMPGPRAVDREPSEGGDLFTVSTRRTSHRAVP
jgi:hypothetical protein